MKPEPLNYTGTSHVRGPMTCACQIRFTFNDPKLQLRCIYP
jgi:hypothetical protein